MLCQSVFERWRTIRGTLALPLESSLLGGKEIVKSRGSRWGASLKFQLGRINLSASNHSAAMFERAHDCENRRDDSVIMLKHCLLLPIDQKTRSTWKLTSQLSDCPSLLGSYCHFLPMFLHVSVYTKFVSPRCSRDWKLDVSIPISL